MIIQTTNNHTAIATLRDQILFQPHGKNLSEQHLAHEEKDTSIYAQENNNMLGAIMVKHISNNIAKLRQLAVVDDEKETAHQLIISAVRFCKDRSYSSIVTNATQAQQALFIASGFEASGKTIISDTGVTLYEMGMSI